MIKKNNNLNCSKSSQITKNSKKQKKSLKNEEIDSSQKKTGKWTKQEDESLKNIVPIYGEKQWRKIASHMNGRTSIQCLHRWTKILKPGLIKGPWTHLEDKKLLDWVEKEGPNKWAQASLIIKGRSGKQIRERWFNNLCPTVKKGNWTREEDDRIFELYEKYGSSWSKLAKYLNGRTENSIKNRFYSTIRKIVADRKKIVMTEKKTDIKDEKIKKPEEKHEFEEEEEIEEEEDENQNNRLYHLLQEKGIPDLKKDHEMTEKSATTRELHFGFSGFSPNKGNYKDFSQRIMGGDDNTTAVLFEENANPHFDRLLENLESSLNEELSKKDLHSLNMMNLEEIQQKMFNYCNKNFIEMKKEEENIKKEEEDNSLLKNSVDNNTEVKKEEKKEDDKMVFLVHQLHTLESMLNKTRQELLTLENSFIDNNFSNYQNQEANCGFNINNKRKFDLLDEEDFDFITKKNRIEEGNFFDFEQQKNVFFNNPL